MAVVPTWVGQGAILVALLGSLAAVRWLDRTREWGQRRRSRLLLGIPWGTLVTACFVLSVYLFVQGGLHHWNNPVVIAFRSWSYRYPLGVVTSAFAHQGVGHLIGNLMGTLVLGSLVEYAWGHFPANRGATTFESARSNPFVRAFVLFPAAVVVVGLLTGIFALGPVAGFSGVVYAFAGFALVRYPIVTVVALTFEDALQFLYNAFQNPVVPGEASTRFISPWWAGIAIQGHLLGVLIGALLGVLLLRSRNRRPNPSRLWLGAVLVGIAMNLWIVWWYRGNGAYVLYRFVGLWLVIVLALLLVVATTASERPLPEWLTVRRVSLAVLGVVGAGWIAWRTVIAPLGLPAFGTPLGPVPVVDAVLAVVAVPFCLGTVVGGDDPVLGGTSRRDVALVVLVLGLVFTAGVAVPTSVSTIDDSDLPGRAAFEIRDYTVTYAENVTNGMVSGIDVSLFGETTNIRTSGVIVRSSDRHLWTTMISTGRLAFAGRSRAVVGGLGWRETVYALRQGWTVRGGPPTYVVFLKPPGGNWTLAHTAERSVAAPVLSGYRVGVRPGSEGFVLDLLENDTVVETASIPPKDANVSLGGITFVREGRQVVATYNGTRIRVAARESYG